jgi:hypothetical protein
VRPDPQVILELRSLFLHGATPSRLIQHIAVRHAAEGNLYFLVQSYFRAAFSTPVLRVSPDVLLQDPQGLELAFLNVHLIHDMILRRPEWAVTDQPDGETTSWIDGLKASNDAALIDQANPEKVPELAKSWGLLDEDAKRYIRRVFGNAQALQEHVLILARLTEQLQHATSSVDEHSRQGDTNGTLTKTPHA